MPEKSPEEIANGYMQTTQQYLQAELEVFKHLLYSRPIGISTHLADLRPRIRAYVESIMPWDSPHGKETRKAYIEKVAVHIKDLAEEYGKSLPKPGEMPTHEESKNNLLAETLLEVAVDLFKES